VKSGADDQSRRPDDAAASAREPCFAEGAASGRLDADAVRRLYEEHCEELQRFLLGVVRDPQLAADAMQAALVKAIEQGHTARDETRKAWLFRVAYHEALLVRRREAVDGRVLRDVVWRIAAATNEPADAAATRNERIEAVRRAIETLPAEQQAVVRMRIHDNLTFAEVADRLGIPLGTALTRMRAALAKLRSALEGHK
jgi:RNA polymerase sigma-70 factor (ECF subfamily)